ncbi:hypothetical protein [uncultured Arenimonas sp.]
MSGGVVFDWDGDINPVECHWTTTGRLSPKNGRLRLVLRYLWP